MKTLNIPKTKILIADDSRSVLLLLTTILEASGYKVLTAENGLKALEKAIADPTIELIVSDVNMPEMSGIQLIKELRKQGLDVPIVVLTGVNNISVAVDALSNGAIDYILKDVQIEETIVVTVIRALEKHQLILKNLHLEQLVEREVRKNREKDMLLMQIEKLASVGHLAAGVAHEINNPISFIMSNLGTLNKYVTVEQQYLHALEDALETYCPEEERLQLVELSKRLDLPFIMGDIPPLICESLEGAERVKRIVHDLKDFARLDDDSLKETDLNQCVQSTANIVRNEIKYVADLELQLNEIPLLICNPQQINQVIANLLLNSAQSIEGHGRITVSTSSESDQVILTVTDTGTGIPAEIRQHIFDPFFTTKDVGKGIGLGLSISYDIVNKHGGEITLASKPGAETTFMVRLPVNGPQGDGNVSV